MKRTPIQDARDQQFDVIVIGGGLVGASIARDAAMRGYRTILLEKNDFGSGTTCRASRLMVGTPVFLERRDLKLLRQLERERHIQMNLAPHLVRPETVTYLASDPKTTPAALKHRMVGSLYAMLLPEGSISRIKPLSARKLQNSCPFLSSDSFQAGYQTADCLVTAPERLCVENLLSAQLNGASVTNYAKVVSVQVHNRQVQGVTAEDRITGKSARLLGRCIVNAAGPWIDQVCRLADDRYISRLRFRKETCVVLPQPASRVEAALVFGPRSDGQSLELVPWRDQLLLGPSSTEPGEELEYPKGSAADIDYLVSGMRELMPSQGFNRQSVLFAFSGVGVLASDTGRSPLSRGARVLVIDHGRAGGPRGLISVVSGKLGHYRIAAEQAVDAIRAHTAGSKARECLTHTERLYGGNIEGMETFIDEVSNAARNYALSDEQVRHLVALYGTKSQEIFQWLKSTPELREPICQHQPDIKAQLLYAVEREMAVTVGDILLRRTGIGVTRCRGLDCAPTAAATLARHLGWSEARVSAEIENYHRELNRIYWKPS